VQRPERPDFGASACASLWNAPNCLPYRDVLKEFL
jgi:hypothetical protein